MNEEHIRKIIEDTYDESKEDKIWSMVKDFYNRRMVSFVVLVWTFGIAFFAGAVYCGIQFFKAEQTKHQIMYSAIFICFVLGIGSMKTFAWQMIHRNNIKREIKRLELRIAALTEAVKSK